MKKKRYMCWCIDCNIYLTTSDAKGVERFKKKHSEHTIIVFDDIDRRI